MVLHLNNHESRLMNKIHDKQKERLKKYTKTANKSINDWWIKINRTNAAVA